MIKHNTANYTTKHLKIFALFCISSGGIISLLRIVRHFNIICHIGDFLHTIIGLWQPMFMGFFQLSRLYYCFSSNQVYSNKGYSTFLFVIMFIVGFLIMSTDIFIALNNICLKCGINLHENFRFDYNDSKLIAFS